jgi:2-polyprenyl-3-methyl-5-hydroxy-6-metoxy-1,4-benzoquinol methylase
LSWTEEEIRAWMARTDFYYYQQIQLPHGIVLPGRDRKPTADVVFRDGVQGKSVLDIGCNYGYFLHEAVRRGAASATGVERNPQRYEIGKTVAEIIGGPLTVRHGALEDLPETPQYDVVLLLNVIHHVVDPFGAMRQVAALARERVVVEFPTLSDRRFLKDAGLSRLLRGRYNRMPCVGVGPKRYMGYYFSPRAFELAFVTQMELFRKVEFVKSPTFRDRVIAFCER